jgi:hypothetical protein
MTVTSSEELILFEQNDNFAIYFSYSLEWINSRLKSPEKVIQGPLVSMRVYRLKGPLAKGDYSSSHGDPTLAFLWDTRLSAMRSEECEGDINGEYITLCTFEENGKPHYAGKGWVVPHLSRWIEKPGIAMSINHSDIYDIGIFGKTTFWAESSPNSSAHYPKQTIERLCFADFPPQRSGNQALNRKVSVSDHETQNESSEDPDEISEDLLDPVPQSIGRTCEFPLFQSWVREYEGVYSVEFDDSRGRLVIATGNGKILVADFV